MKSPSDQQFIKILAETAVKLRIVTHFYFFEKFEVRSWFYGPIEIIC